MITAWLLFLLPLIVRAESSRELRARAANLTYNLDHDVALQLLRGVVVADPTDPANHRALASAIWFDILFRRGAVSVDHYLGSITRSRVDLVKPPVELDTEFKREVAEAIRLAEARVKSAPKDPQAHYDLGSALGLEASYIASVEGRLLAGFRTARQSYDEQERVLELDPQRKEAGLIIGTYRYLVSTLSLPMRVMAYVAGFGGGKERGLTMVEESAAAQTDERTDALFALVLLYNREKRYADALGVLDGSPDHVSAESNRPARSGRHRQPRPPACRCRTVPLRGARHAGARHAPQDARGGRRMALSTGRRPRPSRT